MSAASESERPSYESITGFFDRTQTPSELFHTIQDLQNSIEIRGYAAPSPDILLADSIIHLGRRDLLNVVRRNEDKEIFPRGHRNKMGKDFEQLSLTDADLARHGMAAVIFGTIVKTIHQSFTSPINQLGEIEFDIDEFVRMLNTEGFLGIPFPRIEADRLPVTFPSKTDPKYKIETLSKKSSEKMRAYVEENHTYDPLTSSLWYYLPTCLTSFINSLPDEIRILIVSPEESVFSRFRRRKPHSTSSLRDLYHERALILLAERNKVPDYLRNAFKNTPLDPDDTNESRRR